MAIDVDKTCCGDHSTVYAKTQSLCYIPGTNMLCNNYTSIKKKKKSRKYENLSKGFMWLVIKPDLGSHTEIYQTYVSSF